MNLFYLETNIFLFQNRHFSSYIKHDNFVTQHIVEGVLSRQFRGFGVCIQCKKIVVWARVPEITVPFILFSCSTSYVINVRVGCSIPSTRCLVCQ